MNTFDHFEYRFHLLIYLFIFFFFAFPCRRLKIMETRHVCQTHTCAAMICLRNERMWPSCVCVYKLTEPVIHQRHVHRKGIPTSMLSYVYTSQSLRAIQFSLEPIRAGVQNRHSGRWRTYERYARGPCNRLRRCFQSCLLFRLRNIVMLC